MSFDEQPFLPTDVSIDSAGAISTVGSVAASPTRHQVVDALSVITGPPLVIDTVSVEPVAVVAALIGRCLQEAALTFGEPAEQLRLTAPPSWGPRRRALLLAAAERAGFTGAQLVNAAAAAATYATRTAGLYVPVDGMLMICDITTPTVTCTVLHRRGSLQWEMLATVSRPMTSGTTPPSMPPATADPELVLDEHALHQPAPRETAPAIADPVAPSAGESPDAGLVAAVVRTVVEAIDAADILAPSLTAVACVGEQARRAGLDTAITAMVGIDVAVLPRPGQATVLGCAYADTPTPAAERGVWAPVAAADTRISQIAVMAVAGAGSLLLLIHAVASAYVHRWEGVIDYVLVNRGEFALACALAMVAALTFGRLLVLIRVAMLTENPRLGGRAGPQRLLAAAGAVGVLIAVIYALIAEVGVEHGADGFVAVALWTVLPIAACTGWITFLLPRLAYLGGRALRQLTVPVVPMLLAAVGVATVQYSYVSVPADAAATWARCGGALAGAGCAWLFTARWVARFVAVPLIAAVGALITGFHTLNLDGYAFVISLVVWWLLRTGQVSVDAFPQLRTGTWSWTRRVSATTGSAPAAGASPSPIPAGTPGPWQPPPRPSAAALVVPTGNLAGRTPGDMPDGPGDSAPASNGHRPR